MKIFTYIKNDSSRIPRKNFQKIGNLELWKHLLYEISSYEVYIDTDSDEVIKECSIDPMLKNVVAYKRHPHMVAMENDPDNNLSPALLMVENFLDKYIEDPDEKIILTHVTSPFLKVETIEAALNYFELGYEFIHSIHSIQDFAWFGEKFEPLNFNPKVVQRTQDVEKVHFSNGAFFIFSKKSFKKYGNRFGDNNFYYELNNIESIEIDTTEDLELAKIVYKGMKSND